MKARICPTLDDLAGLSPDVGVLGFPYDLGTSARSGARTGPRAACEAPTVFADALCGLYGPVLDRTLDRGQTVVDCGDADASP